MRDSRDRQGTGADALRRLFTDLVGRSFADLGISGEGLGSYVIDLLVRFSRTDALYRVSDLTGKRLETVVEMLIDLAGWDGPHDVQAERERRLKQHIGDYTLFMSGVFRSYVERHGFLDFYLQEGRRAYRDAAALERTLYLPGASRFEALADGIERLSGALDYMRKVYFFAAARQSRLDDLVRRFGLLN